MYWNLIIWAMPIIICWLIKLTTWSYSHKQQEVQWKYQEQGKGYKGKDKKQTMCFFFWLIYLFSIVFFFPLCSHSLYIMLISTLQMDC